ncbi:uncharacterized protein LOC105279255 [Ooceraea biroi]|uniref:uncharacterized protein LOC105279255 n=1 Tax=Ooceraea biroi TaxID=2015173 RepID=UPI000F080835|nr:uncharacterized protein LOC105279255 [Ooceraea biroi]
MLPTCVFILVMIECKPLILDIVIPMNVFRPRKTEMDFEFFVDKEQYFFLYIMQEILTLVTGFYSILIPGTFFVTIGRHCCAIYKIASCLIANTAIVHTQIPVAQKIQFMHRSICLSVHIHRRAMKFVKDLVQMIDLWYFPLFVICIASLSCLLFRLHITVMQTNDLHDIFMCCVLLYVFHVFVCVTFSWAIVHRTQCRTITIYI